MKSMILNCTYLVCVTAFIISCNSKNGAPQTEQINKEQIKREIQAKEDSFASVYNSGELRSIGYYADDAITFFQNREPLVGKDAIISFLKGDISANSGQIAFTTNEV